MDNYGRKLGTGALVCALAWVTACSSSSSAGSAPGTPSTQVDEYAAVVRGQLASTDMATNKAAHDAIAEGGESASKAAGDFAHDVLLGTTMLDSTKDEFLAIDRWHDANAMKTFYADPKLQQSFGSLFAKPPTIQFFKYAPNWVSWGTMDSGDAYQPYYFHLALGVLKLSDMAANQQAHDQVAAGGKDPSIAAGNVAHLVFLGLDDPRQFVAVDIWGKGDAIQAFYSSPQFVAAFAPLFESVSQPVYQSTDWYQW